MKYSTPLKADTAQSWRVQMNCDVYGARDRTDLHGANGYRSKDTVEFVKAKKLIFFNMSALWSAAVKAQHLVKTMKTFEFPKQLKQHLHESASIKAERQRISFILIVLKSFKV